MTEFEEKILSQEPEPLKDENSTPQPEEGSPEIPTLDGRTRRFLRNLVRWTLTLLIVFGLGALTVYFVYLAPAHQDLSQADTQLEQITQQVDSLKEQLDEAIQTNQELEHELKATRMQIVLMEALSDVRAAHISVAYDDYPGALLSLKDASQALEQLSETISEEQREIITALQDDLAEIEAELKSDPESAQLDLERLTTNLIRLESSISK